MGLTTLVSKGIAAIISLGVIFSLIGVLMIFLAGASYGFQTSNMTVITIFLLIYGVNILISSFIAYRLWTCP